MFFKEKNILADYKEYMKKRYSKACRYDSGQSKWKMRYYQILRNTELESIFKKFHCSKILDIATGTGQNSVYLAEKGFEIIGADLTETMLREAIVKRDDKRLKYPLFLLSDGTKLPFKDSSFDAISAMQLFHLYDDDFRKVFLGEFHRAVKNDGVIVIHCLNALSWFLPGVINYIRHVFGGRPYRYTFPWQAVSLVKEKFEVLEIRGESLPFIHLLARKNLKLAFFLNNFCSVFPFKYICSTFLITARKKYTKMEKSAKFENIFKAIGIIQNDNFGELGFCGRPSYKLYKIIERPFSNIARVGFYSNGKNFAVYIKEPYTNIENKSERKQKVRAHHSFLKLLYENFSIHDNFSAIRPIFLFEDLGIIVTEEKRGFPFADLIRSQKYSPFKTRLKELEKYIFLCGKFLSEFQKSDKFLIDSNSEIKKIPDYVLTRIDKIADDYNFPEIRDSESAIMQFLNSLCNKDIPDNKYVKSFKDYHPGNILISEGKITPFDPSEAGGFDGAHLYQDVCTFYVWLDDIDFGFRRKTISEFKKTFLEGYGQIDAEDDPIFKIFLIVHKILGLCRIFKTEKMPFIKNRKARKYLARFKERFEGACLVR